MAAHARLKNEFTEDEKYHNIMSWLNFITLMNTRASYITGTVTSPVLCTTFRSGHIAYNWEQGTATECLGSEGWHYMQCFLQCEFGHLYTLFNTLKEF